MSGAAQRIFRNLVAGVLLTLSGAICAAPAPPAPHAADLRVLVDVSGSMKHTDPQNLRIPAVRLLAELLPPDARAGIWTFAQGVNMIVPPGAADAAWKAEAERASRLINSRGLYTDIEQALDKATAGWAAGPGRQRDLILLTDGMVDISKDATVSAASRERILDDVLPRLRKAGIQVNTIALSQEADHRLMRELAIGTGGQYHEVNDAAQLERVFLHLFERAAAPNSLPLKDNRFETDASVKEATVLVFHAPKARPTEIVRPDGTRFGQASAPPNVRWHHEDRYDLVTISHPAAGTWQLIADVDPDNRVMIATDLQLQMGSLPNNVLAGEKLNVVADLTNKGKPVKREDFLKLLHVTLTATAADGASKQILMKQVQDGSRFQAQTADFLHPGRYELAVLVDGHTFQREQRQSIQVYDNPVVAQVAPLKDTRGGAYRISFAPNPELVSSDGLQLALTLKGPKGTTSKPKAQRQPDGSWRVAVKGLGPGIYHLDYAIKGKTVRGRDFTAQPKALQLEGPKAPPPAVAAVKPAPEPAKHKPESAPPAEPNWGLTLAVVGGTNAIVLLPGAFGFMLWRRRRKAKQQAPEEEM